MLSYAIDVFHLSFNFLCLLLLWCIYLGELNAPVRDLELVLSLVAAGRVVGLRELSHLLHQDPAPRACIMLYRVRIVTL